MRYKTRMERNFSRKTSVSSCKKQEVYDCIYTYALRLRKYRFTKHGKGVETVCKYMKQKEQMKLQIISTYALFQGYSPLKTIHTHSKLVKPIHKQAWHFTYEGIFWKPSEGEMLITSQT